MRLLPSLLAASIALGLSGASSDAFAAKGDKKADASIYSSIKLRNMGPAVTGGRVSDFAFNPENPAEYFVATASGGMWKTDNAGVTWQAVADSMPSYSYGDVTMDPNNKNVIWAGTGENNSQRSVAYGDGVYKSVDGGQSWENVGLKNSEHIGEILIDPRNSDVVYVASQGPLWSKGGDRGLFKTTDGGKTWENVLEISEHTGVSDIAFDPQNPDVIYATSYQRRRHVWTLINGGPESSIYKSTDAGKTWNKIEKGLPSVDKGRIGIDVAPTDGNIIYAIVEAADGKSGFYRSTDAGASWHKQSSYVSGSPQYYQEIVVDPKNPHRVYSLDTYLMVSEDGGKNFTRAGEAHKHVDNHALWIDPNNTNHLIIGSDGGVYESWDRAKNWTFKDNMPLTQFYKVTVDNDYPFYNVFGGTQDNASLGAPHRTTTESGIQNSDWLFTQFGDGFKTVIDPKNPDIIYSQYQYGGLARYDKQSGERVQMQPVTPDPAVAQRFNWNSPLLISPHNNERIYYGSQTLFQSDNRGDDWRAISGDLSRNIDRNKLEVMDTVWGVDTVAKNTSTSFYGSLIALTESPLQEGLLYTGSDDGVMHVTKDGGQAWTKLDWPSKVPDNSYVADMEASVFDKNTVFAVFDNHKRGDFKPYVYRSDNNGKSWKNITGDLPVRGSTYTIAQDHQNKDLLFVGTEFGVFFTQNGGKNWVQLKSGMPTIAVRDIEIQRRESDLALATFGRGFYILDDYSSLREDAKAVKKQDATLFPVRRAFQFIEHSPLGLPGKAMRGADFYFAENPEYGAAFSFYINEEFKSLKAQRQAKEAELRKDEKPVYYPSWDALKEEDFEQKPSLLLTVRDDEGNIVRRIKAPAKKGFNRIHWDLRYPGFEPVDASGDQDSGWLVVPGKYTVSLSKLVKGVETSYDQEQSFEVVSIDNRTFPSTDRKADLAFDMKAGRLSNAIAGARKYLGELESRIKHIKVATTETLALDQTTLALAHQMQRDLEEIKLDLNGDSVVAKRAEPTPTSVNGYIGYLMWSRSESTSPVSGQQKLRFKRASEGYADIYQRIVQLAESVKLTEEAIAKAGGNWLPGTLPANGK
ncbi:VPS10 domain-containing protein [Thalassotalea euphylliae]|uniref:Glycosyl hydrolase n=1 Tax=Thalassotalea euphylliae TaxID=1655234 RepID=A0A3E0UE98_9GAMM|nr:glycosyl hydrolase [Thalassotalea euphylliae]REL35209.1 glycosyl hydrolase [Thalassotalea euphylliae]